MKKTKTQKEITINAEVILGVIECLDYAVRALEADAEAVSEMASITKDTNEFYQELTQEARKAKRFKELLLIQYRKYEAAK